tara:strand:- start:673 stop:813 length:141 start_codon:yes stop_codon:yes gene_type:complete
MSKKKKEKIKEIDLRKGRSKKKVYVSSLLLGLVLASMIVIGEMNSR